MVTFLAEDKGSVGLRTIAAVALGSNLASNLGSKLGSKFGSSIGDRETNLQAAVDRMSGLGKVLAVSSFYDTEPVGYVAQPRFLNGALLLDTKLEPLELMRGLLAVEQAMGRDRVGAVAKGPRTIDLDLLLYGTVVMDTDELTLPHPAMQEREFVLRPLAEIAPGMRHPVLGLTVEEMLEQLVSK